MGNNNYPDNWYGHIERMADQTARVDVPMLSGQSLSDEIDLDGWKFITLIMPHEFTGTTMTIAVSRAKGDNYVPLFDDGGTEVSFPVSINRAISIDANALKLAACRYIRLRAGTSASPSVQASTRAITVLLKK